MLKVYNTLTGNKDEFKPIKENKVGMYVCGPTVYDLSHIGHARSAVSFDVVYRYLKYLGFEVTYTKNYTDIDDKIIKRALEEGVTSKELAERYIEAYDKDMASLMVSVPSIRPKATETMEEIISIIETLIEKDYAYEVEGDVMYRVRNFQGYGKLSGKNIEELESGARVEVDNKKEDPLDFALWKNSKPNEPSWESPWGSGRPGWHIECSAMCLKHLGETIDIHGGGRDLVFPHHENEIAQSEAATGKPFAKHWLHNGFVNIEKEKMSKSLGNILNIQEALKSYTPEAIRLFLLSSHYRSPIEYGPDTLKESEAKAERLFRVLYRIEEECPAASAEDADAARLDEKLKPIKAAMDDDFNTAAAIGKLFEEAQNANKVLDSNDKDARTILSVTLALIKEADSFLGIFEKKPSEYFDEKKSMAGVDPIEIERLINERNTARREKDFQLADKIRDGLLEKGVVLEDAAGKTSWTIKN